MKTSNRAIITLFTLALFVGACTPASAAGLPQPLIQNTQSPQEAQSLIETAVAQTVEAQNQIGTSVAQTLAAQATPTFVPTLVTLPTLTPFVVPSPTSRPVGGGVPPKANYACDFIRLRPTAYAEFNRGQKFDIKMTIVNTGTRNWYQGYDLKYSGGAVMTSTTFIELPAMAPNAQYQVVLDAVAPTERGVQTMTWMVEGRLCFGYVVITVK